MYSDELRDADVVRSQILRYFVENPEVLYKRLQERNSQIVFYRSEVARLQRQIEIERDSCQVQLQENLETERRKLNSVKRRVEATRETITTKENFLGVEKHALQVQKQQLAYGKKRVDGALREIELEDSRLQKMQERLKRESSLIAAEQGKLERTKNDLDGAIQEALELKDQAEKILDSRKAKLAESLVASFDSFSHLKSAAAKLVRSLKIAFW